MTDTNLLHRLVLPLRFPAGLAPGAGKSASNVLELARDGQGRAVLRGSTIAGCLRHAWARRRGLDLAALDPDDEIARFFGAAVGSRSDFAGPSPLQVTDVVLDTGRALDSERRHHNAVVRHDGAVRDGGLFTVETLPAGTRGIALLTLRSDADDARTFLEEVVELFAGGLLLGGHGARGIGR